MEVVTYVTPLTLSTPSVGDRAAGQEGPVQTG